MVMQGQKHVASHTIKHVVFDHNYFIILVLNSGCLQSINFFLLQNIQTGPSSFRGVYLRGGKVARA